MIKSHERNRRIEVGTWPASAAARYQTHDRKGGTTRTPIVHAVLCNGDVTYLVLSMHIVAVMLRFSLCGEICTQRRPAVHHRPIHGRASSTTAAVV
jgi:hypothetical protein